MVEGAVADRDRRQRRLEVELEALDGRDEPAQRDERGGPRPATAEAERVRHHGALREAAEHGALRRMPVVSQRPSSQALTAAYVGRNVAGSG